MNILIGTSVRQDTEVFKYYLDSIDRLKVPDGCYIGKLFVLHNSPELVPIIESRPDFGKSLNYIVANDNTEYKKDENTHHWNDHAINSISEIKNHILTIARTHFDSMFFVDSDLILHPDTLVHLVAQQKDIIAEVFLTKWSENDIEAPNAWDYDAYTFAPDLTQEEYNDICLNPEGELYEIAKVMRINQWRNPGVYKIGMSGACILLSRKVLDCRNVNYNRVSNVSLWGEDRHFCIRAAAHDFEIWLDTHYPARHLYRPSEVEKYRNELTK